MSTLRITTGPAEGQSIDCDRELVIGREGADVIVEDWEMSRRHAAIRPVAAGLEVEDLGSLNGTFVDGQRISGATLLTAANTLKMGATHFAVEIAASDEPLLDPQRTVISQAEREQPSAEPVADVADRTTVRKVPTDKPSAEPVADIADRTTVRKVPTDTPSAEPVADVADRTSVRDAPIIDVADRTVVREIVPQMPPAPRGDAAAGGPPAGAGAPGGPTEGGAPSPGPAGGAPAGFPPGGAPPGFPPGGPPAPVRLLLKTPFGRRLMPLLFKLRQRRASRRGS